MSSAAIQVPCFALLCLLIWKLGVFAIGKWSQQETERTKVIAKGDEERTLAIARGFADITAELKNHGERLGRIEDRLDVRDAIVEAIDDAATGRIPVPVDDAA